MKRLTWTALLVCAPGVCWAAPNKLILAGDGVDLTKAPATAAVLQAGASVSTGSVVCDISGADWATVTAGSRRISVDEQRFRPGWLDVQVAPDENGCGKARAMRLFLTREQSLHLVESTITVYPQSSVIEATGSELGGQELVVLRDGRVAATGACLTDRSCSVRVQPELLRSWLAGEDVGALVWPQRVPLDPGQVFPDMPRPDGSWTRRDELYATGVRFLFTRPLIEAREIDVTQEHAVVEVPLLQAIQDVSCKRARCTLTPRGIEVFAVDADTLSVGLRLQLKPEAFRLVDGRQLSREILEMPIVRCGMRVPDGVPLLAGATSHRYFVALSRECFDQSVGELGVETQPPTVSYVKSEAAGSDPSWRYFEIVIDKVPSETRQLEVTLTRRTPQRTTLASVRVPVARGFRPSSVRLDVPNQGLIDFIPSNREARLDLAFDDPRWRGSLRVEDRQGFYSVRADGDATWVRAVKGAAGSVALRLAYTPPALVDFLHHEQPLALFETEARYALRSINVALPLADPSGDSPRFVRVVCRAGDDIIDIPVGRTVTIPYRDRNSCRILFDREAIPEWAGEQQLRLQSGWLNEIVTLAHQEGTLSIALPVDGKGEFDTLSVSVGHEYGSGHYDLSPRHNLGPEARYHAVLGDRTFRISASTSLPTGLFRFGSKADRGAVPLSAGGVGRLVWLYREGIEFPIGLEVGILGTGLSSDPNLSLVTGFGFSVPVLNANTTLQTSFNLHAWLEYSPTRTGEGRSPWAFLFGPSFAVGKFSANL